eukprot:CAMPEP_0171337380 /NCGR_PEP_ID=MMETSP0878-20121228/6655_1 /TAXON_ID=67004 /ORGANISM="Thalassiosira weissflogii, Strain CCMP1336" /LENGTH=737 /DNA_ID=CAMNT_0011838999 /DNA_START=226 /DNA_END=2439 /DNA_ORIENTATION=-
MSESNKVANAAESANINEDFNEASADDSSNNEGFVKVEKVVDSTEEVNSDGAEPSAGEEKVEDSEVGDTVEATNEANDAGDSAKDTAEGNDAAKFEGEGQVSQKAVGSSDSPESIGDDGGKADEMEHDASDKIFDDEQVLEEEEDVGKNEGAEDEAPTIKAALQAAAASEDSADGGKKFIRASTQDTEGTMEDCALTPLDGNRQKQTLKDAIDNAVANDEGTGGEDKCIGPEEEGVAHVKFSDHNETYNIPERDGIPKPPFNESALHRDENSDDQASPSPLNEQGRRHPGDGHQRKQPSKLNKFKKPSIRFTVKKNHSIAETTAPPESSSFRVASQKFKHNILNSIGEFLNSAFADDEETSGSYFSQDLLEQLGKNDPTIKGVWLQSKGLNDHHIQQLCEPLIRNKVVTEVWLPSNNITDVGAAHLAHMLKFNKSIKELFLGENRIGPKGAAALAVALARGNNTLVALGLGDNQIGVEGAGAFAAALRHNHSLHTLDIKGNGIPRNSSIRGLLHKMLEFNSSDPGDESLVIGLQEELAALVSSLPPDVAEDVVLQAEHALKTAILCRKRGDKIGAAEAEGLFIRICTTGQKPEDPPEMTVGMMGGVKKGSNIGSKNHNQMKSRKDKGGKKLKKPTEPDRLDELNQELSTLKFHEKNDAAGELRANRDVARNYSESVEKREPESVSAEETSASVFEEVNEINSNDAKTVVPTEEKQESDNGEVKLDEKINTETSKSED